MVLAEKAKRVRDAPNVPQERGPSRTRPSVSLLRNRLNLRQERGSQPVGYGGNGFPIPLLTSAGEPARRHLQARLEIQPRASLLLLTRQRIPGVDREITLVVNLWLKLRYDDPVPETTPVCGKSFLP